MSRLRRISVMVAMSLSTQAFGQPVSGPGGDWSGSYSCVQGETALHLRITPQADGSLAALFRFGSLPPHRPVPEGCFLMTGTFDPTTRRVILSPGKWLLQPPGFVSVGLDGTLDGSGVYFSGGVTGGFSCTTFNLDRTASTPAIDGPCGNGPSFVATR